MRLRIPFFGNLQPSDPKASRLEKLGKLYRLCVDARKPHEKDWLMNATYLRGNQLDELPQEARRVIGRRAWLPRESRKVAYVGNRMLALYRQALTYLVDGIGRQIAIPATGQSEDEFAAELGTDLLDYLQEKNRERARRMTTIGWTLIAARVLDKVMWDDEVDGLGEWGVLEGAGDIETTTLNPLQFYLDPWAVSLDEASFVLEVGIRDVDEIKRLFGEAAKDLQQEEVSDTTYLLDTLLGSLTATRYGAPGFMQAPKREGGVLLKVWHFAPTPTNKEGLVIWEAGGKELRQEKLPEGRMPFVELVWLPLPGQAQPMAFCTPLRSPAHYMNVLRSQMIQLANMQLRGDTMRRGSGKVKQEIDPETGRKDLVADAGVEQFELMRYQLDWAASAKVYEDMWDDSQQIAGLRSSSIGENPPGVQTIGQLLLLKEPDVAGMKMFKVGYEEAYAREGLLQLQVAQKHYKEKRLLRLVDDRNGVRTAAFLGSQLRGVVDVRTRSLPQMSEAERRQAIQEGIDKGFFGPWLGVDGAPSLQVKRAKLKALLNSGIPEGDKMAEDLAAPLSLEELDRACQQLEMMDLEREVLRRQAEMAQLQAVMQPAQEEEPDEEAQAMAMMGMGPAQGAQVQPQMPQGAAAGG